MSETESTQKECFVIMPISDPEQYTAGHFSNVYEHVIKPCVIKAGFSPIRADEVKTTNLIHVDILKRLINAPMAVCDLSSRNPNVLFELGIRQAFNKPVALIQEKGTPRVFDISLFRIHEYRKELDIVSVQKFTATLTECIRETYFERNTDGNINSLIPLLLNTDQLGKVYTSGRDCPPFSRTRTITARTDTNGKKFFKYEQIVFFEYDQERTFWKLYVKNSKDTYYMYNKRSMKNLTDLDPCFVAVNDKIVVNWKYIDQIESGTIIFDDEFYSNFKIRVEKDYEGEIDFFNCFMI